jgi:hypothetical protein
LHLGDDLESHSQRESAFKRQNEYRISEEGDNNSRRDNELASKDTNPPKVEAEFGPHEIAVHPHHPSDLPENKL